MKPVRKASTCLLIISLLLFISAFVFSDEVTVNYTSKVIESFDNPNARPWIVRGSKFATEGYPKMTYANAWPEALFGRNKDKKDLKCLGIHGKFNRKAYNYIEIIPAKKDKDGNLVPSPIQLPGRVKAIDLWVWGSNHDYYLEVHLRDYQGIEHVLRLGSLNYAGWRDLMVTIPSSIPQSRRYLPRRMSLQLTKFVMWTKPTEDVSDFYLYLDQVKILTDTFESRYDGDNLVEPDVIKKIWGTSETGKK